MCIGAILQFQLSLYGEFFFPIEREKVVRIFIPTVRAERFITGELMHRFILTRQRR